MIHNALGRCPCSPLLLSSSKHPDLKIVFMAQARFGNVRHVAVFDGSGKEGQGCTIVAGFVASLDDWMAFDREWTPRLKKDGLEYFHMVDFAACQDQFKKWRGNEQRRIDLLSDLIGIIQSHAYRKFASSVSTPNLSKLSPENRSEFRMNAYVLAARASVADVSLWKRRENMQHVCTAYAFEEGDDGQGKLSERMRADGYQSPFFLPKKPYVGADGAVVEAFTPLQAADILAYEVGKAIRDFEQRGPLDRLRKPLEMLEQIPGEIGEFTVKDMAALDKELSDIRQRTKAAVGATLKA